MMTEKPEPLTPSDCDLRGMPYMPLDVVRLFDSDFYALSNGEEFKAGLSLWCKAFLQVPAGSLPSDDRLLAHLSGSGGAWKRVKEMALRGWIECSDGRLYHRTVAEKALEAWRARLDRRARTEAARAAREAARQGARAGSDNEPPPPVTDPHTNDVATNVTNLPTDNGAISVTDNVTASKGTEGKGTEGKGTEGKLRKEEEEEPSLRSGSARGCRLPPDWMPDHEDRQFAREQNLDPDAVVPRFRDYWHAKAGQNGTKLDWHATWRNWCRTEAEGRAPGKQSPVIIDAKVGRRAAFVLPLEHIP